MYRSLELLFTIEDLLLCLPASGLLRQTTLKCYIYSVSLLAPESLPIMLHGIASNLFLPLNSHMYK